MTRSGNLVAQSPVVVDNAAIAELLSREAKTAEGHREQAFRRAAHAAFMWSEESTDIAAAGRSLTELAGIGHSLAKRLHNWIASPPEVEVPAIRREFLTLAHAQRVLKKNPRWAPQLNGDLQMHTTWSDGGGTIADMAAAAIDRGYKFIGITDHTQSLSIAGGLDETRLAEQGREIVALNKQLRQRGIDFTILRSAEMNLSPEGAGDMRPTALRKLDLVLGCFHSALRRKEDQTSRYLAGLRNPGIQILGHPQTRVWNRREGLKADWSAVFAEAARLDKAVEIDGYVDRQDLRISLLKVAAKRVCAFRSAPTRTIRRAQFYGAEPRRSCAGEDSRRANHQFYERGSTQVVGAIGARFFRTESNSTCSIFTRQNASQSLATSPSKHMPDVGLFTATEPLSKDMKVIIKYSVEGRRASGLFRDLRCRHARQGAQERRSEGSGNLVPANQVRRGLPRPSRIQLVPYSLPLGRECL